MANSESHKRIYAAVRQIPRGQVATYGQIAVIAGYPKHARLVGYALHGCPRNLPWHRVVNTKGCISLPVDSTAAITQRRRLADEGVVFLGGKTDLSRYQWCPDQRLLTHPDPGIAE